MKAYKYRGGAGILDKDGNSVFERDINTILNNQIYLPTKHELNDPTEGFYNDSDIVSFFKQNQQHASETQKAYGKLVEKYSNLGIYSLSKNSINELMWAYYGGGHTGFAIEYDIDILKESLNHNMFFEYIFELDVEYANSVPNADTRLFAKNDTDEYLRTYIGTKSLSWQHEEEHRLIFEGKGLFDIDFRAITGIYFGCRMPEPQIDYIMQKLQGRNLSYYKIELIENTYQFKSNKIEDRYANASKYKANNLSYDIDQLLMPKDILGDKAYSYKDRLIEALEIVRFEPLISEIYIATISIDTGEPMFIIWAYTKSGVPASREFNFKLDKDGNLCRVK